MRGQKIISDSLAKITGSFAMHTRNGMAGRSCTAESFNAAAGLNGRRFNMILVAYCHEA